MQSASSHNESAVTWIKEFFFFNPPLVEFFDVWSVLAAWNALGFAFVYLMCGLIAACVFRRNRISVLFPVVSALTGAVMGFSLGAVFSLIVAGIYGTGPFEMRWYMGLGWGLGMPFVYTVHSLSKFVFTW